MAYDDGDDNPFEDPADANPLGSLDPTSSLAQEYNPFGEDQSGVKTSVSAAGSTSAYNNIPDDGDALGSGDAWGGGDGVQTSADKGEPQRASMSLPSDAYGDDDGAERLGGGGGGAMTHEELDRREAILMQQEREAREKEMLIRTQEQKTLGTYVLPDNWPCECYPVTYHNIKEDVGHEYQPHVKKLYSIVLLSFFCFIWNVIAITAAWFATLLPDNNLAFIWSGAYMFIGSWFAWSTWYKGMYSKLRSTQHAKKWAIKWWWMLFWFGAHVIWCGFCVVGPLMWGMAGVYNVIDCFNGTNGTQGSVGVGIVVLISAVAWGVNLLASMLMWKRSWNVYKSLGISEQAQKEFQGLASAAEFAANNADRFVPTDADGNIDLEGAQKGMQAVAAASGGGLKMSH